MKHSDKKMAKQSVDKSTIISEKVMGFFNRIGLWLYANQPIVDKTTQFCYLFGLMGVAGWGVFVAIPFLYSEYDPWKGALASFIGYFSAIQIFINWLGIKCVDSSYKPAVHGTIPEGLREGENICDARTRKTQQQENGSPEAESNGKSGRKRKDATAVPMRSLMYVATEAPTVQNPVPKRTAYPYFSWTPCLRCNRARPPRCHHCPLCNVCVMKRDHHCFFAGACIGYRNQRYFNVFIFWATVATVFASIHGTAYFYYEVLPHTRWFDFLFPVALLRALFGYISTTHAVLIVLLWLLAGFLMMSIGFVQRAYGWLATSKTTFEEEFKMRVTDTRDMSGKLRGVFGKCWILNFIIPLHFVFDVEEDPIRWPTIWA